MHQQCLHIKQCPNQWKKGWPVDCPAPPKPVPAPLPAPLPKPGPSPVPAPPAQVHNILYLVDEHNITNIPPNQKLLRNGTTLQKRYAWHHQVANLSTFNVGEEPETIQLHEMIGNPTANKTFRWEGYMFGESHVSLQFLSCYCKNP